VKAGSLVKMPTGRFWWNNRVGVVTEVRMGGFSNHKGEHIVKEECKVEFGDDFIWYQSRNVEVVSVG